MSERLELTLAGIVLLALAIAWGVFYVGPKNDALFAARECMEQYGGMDAHASDSPEWEQCFNEADKAHGNKLLTVVGY